MTAVSLSPEQFRPDLGPVTPEHRRKAQWILAAGDSMLVRGREPWQPLSADEYRWCGMAAAEEYCLGSLDGQPLCLALAGADDPLPDKWAPADLRSVLPGLSGQQFFLLARARQVLCWLMDHRWCGRCGSRTAADAKERALRCPACSALWYPRISPCVIVLVLRGEEMLLARGARFPGRFFSTLAGFVDVGETLEQTLAREIREETSVEAGNFRYFGSQPWPFPSQLMLGFFADYRQGALKPDGEEILEADWFHHSSLPQVPGPGFSIAGELIATAVHKLQQGQKP